MRRIGGTFLLTGRDGCGTFGPAAACLAPSL